MRWVVKGDRRLLQANDGKLSFLWGAPCGHCQYAERAGRLWGAGLRGFATAFVGGTGIGVATITAAIAGMCSVVRSMLKISEDRNILCAISFGYEDKEHPANQFRTARVGRSGRLALIDKTKDLSAKVTLLVQLCGRWVC